MSFAELLASKAETRTRSLADLSSLLEPMDDRALAALASRAMSFTRRYFGRTMRLFAPLYLSNECINNCAYCGFSRDNPILRVTLTPDQVENEARYLANLGFRSLLLVSGEHPKFVSNNYLSEIVRRINQIVPSVSLEVAPLKTDEYRRMIEAGAEGLVVYQETYNPEIYRTLHTAGPKRNFVWRLETCERAYAAGFRRLGLGALFGLAPWREEAISLARHIEFLLRRCWRSQLTVAFPRLRPAAGGFQPLTTLSDRELIQLVCAFRVTFPQVGIVLSTREPAWLRNLLAHLGVTTMSAGSRTAPGAYTGQGTESLHLTVRGRVQEASCPAQDANAEPQFSIDDHRTPQEVAEALTKAGLDPVWKDWDAAILNV
jgi:2-iminoacetate synthase